MTKHAEIAAEPTDGRCEDYCNDPAVVYHAHDLPRCKNVCVVVADGRWLCNTHAQLRLARAEITRLEAERDEAQMEFADRIIARDAAEAEVATLRDEIELREIICEQVTINGMTWAEFKERFARLATPTATAREGDE